MFNIVDQLEIVSWLHEASTEQMADPATGRRHHKGTEAPPVPPHLSRAVALQDEPQYGILFLKLGAPIADNNYYWLTGAGHEEVTIPMDDVNADQVEYAMEEEENQDPHFGMSVCIKIVSL